MQLDEARGRGVEKQMVRGPSEDDNATSSESEISKGIYTRSYIATMKIALLRTVAASESE